jgi:hypothetical protein
LRFGDWIWRFDLMPAGPSETKVTLTCDWSVVNTSLRQSVSSPSSPRII